MSKTANRFVASFLSKKSSLDSNQISELVREAGKYYSKDLSSGNCAVFAVALHKFLGSDPTDKLGVIEVDIMGQEPEIAHVVLVHQGEAYDPSGIQNPDVLVEIYIDNYGKDLVENILYYEVGMEEAKDFVDRTSHWTSVGDMVRTLQRAAKRLWEK